MLKITRKQQERFAQDSERKFVLQMVEHLNAFAPEHAARIGDDKLEQIVRLGIDRAGHYGLSQRGPVRYYIEVMFILGSDFDTDPQYGRPSAVLSRDWVENGTQVRRAFEFRRDTEAYLSAASGDEHQYVIDMLERALSTKLEFQPTGRGAIPEEIAGWLQALAPQKCDVIGDKALGSLIRRGIAAANRLGARTHWNRAFIVFLMFDFGHGCLTDLQFPWIGSTFRNDDGSELEPQDRLGAFSTLRKKTLLYLQQALGELG